MITRRLARPAGTLLSSSSWTCPACTRASLLSRSRLQSRRGLQQMPELAHDRRFAAEGVPGLLSPDGYTIAWTKYQGMMLNKLNELLAGEPYENASVKALTLQFARNPMSASIFNHASMAHNNHWFFSALSLVPNKLEKHPSLEQSLIKTFGSIETLRSTMLDTAASMFGPGFVWLVWARDVDEPSGERRQGSWRILTTYNAGTPYPEAGYRQQGLDMNTNNFSSHSEYMDSQRVTNSVGMFGNWTRSAQDRAKLPPGGANVMPVLCVNTWEHVWLRDYGPVGKRSFLNDWWDVVDWSWVDATTPGEAKGQELFRRERAV